jgi:hypothetical protein
MQLQLCWPALEGHYGRKHVKGMVQLYWVGATGWAATVLVGAMGWCYRHALQLWVAKEPRHTAQDVDSKLKALSALVCVAAGGLPSTQLRLLPCSLAATPCWLGWLSYWHPRQC